LLPASFGLCQINFYYFFHINHPFDFNFAGIVTGGCDRYGQNRINFYKKIMVKDREKLNLRRKFIEKFSIFCLID